MSLPAGLGALQGLQPYTPKVENSAGHDNASSVVSAVSILLEGAAQSLPGWKDLQFVLVQIGVTGKGGSFSLLVLNTLGMELMAPTTVYALNGSSIRLTCTFNSCYQVDKKQFSLNWTYQNCQNCTEEMVSVWTGGWTIPLLHM